MVLIVFECPINYAAATAHSLADIFFWKSGSFESFCNAMTNDPFHHAIQMPGQSYKELYTFNQGILTEGEGSVQLTSSLK
jgi:hypothetical protein